MSPFEGILLFFAGFPLACLAGLLGTFGFIVVTKRNGSSKLAIILFVVPFGVVLFTQLLGLFVASASSSLLIEWMGIGILVLLMLAPGIYVNRKLSQKIRLSRTEFIKATTSFFLAGLVFGVVMGVTILTDLSEEVSERADYVFFWVITPLSMAIAYTILGWLIIRGSSKSPSRIAYILPDWLLEWLDPSYIPPHDKEQRKQKESRNR